MHASASSDPASGPGAHGSAVRAADLAARLESLIPIGLSDRGTNRLAWTPEDARAAAWFSEQAAALGLRTERDPAGNLWAMPGDPGPWWIVASHLDSVRDGGRFDGALGVAAGFAVAAKSTIPVAVVSFADEEGARFNTPTFGSKALTGTLDVEDVLARTDDDGVDLRAALEAAGVDPEGLHGADGWLERVRGVLELHIDQTTDVAATGQPAGIVTGLASRLRLVAEVTGRADHAGTTRRAERADALAAAARLIVTAQDLTPDDPDFVFTAARILVEPNAVTTIPARARVWFDARSPSPQALADWQDALEAQVATLARGAGVRVDLEVASRGPGIEFDPEVRAALRAASEQLGQPARDVLCFAGHDAGIVARHRPAGMVFVRNASGVSHSPDESVELEDAAFAASIVLAALERLGAAEPGGAAGPAAPAAPAQRVGTAATTRR
jgi:N-carbamoyl-L-amino-acid hydrolase